MTSALFYKILKLFLIAQSKCFRDSQLVNFLSSNDIIHHLQSGNRKFHSTESASLHFTDELLNNMDQRKISVIVVLLDFSKAFDSIQHDLMLCKLRKAGVSETACAWFESYCCVTTYTSSQDPEYLIPPLTRNGRVTARIHLGPSTVYIICKWPPSGPKTLQSTRLCG